MTSFRKHRNTDNSTHPPSLLARRRNRPRSSLLPCPFWVRFTVVAALVYTVCVAYFFVTFRLEIQRDADVRRRDADVQRARSAPGISNAVSSSDGKESVSQPRMKREEKNPASSFLQSAPLSLWKGPFTFSKDQAEATLRQWGTASVRRILSAYLEPPMNDTIPGTGSQGSTDNDDDVGIPPDFVVPLPLRTNTPDDLIHLSYPKLQTCHDVPAKIPVDRGLQYDEDGNVVVWNVGDEPTPDDFPMQEAVHCPVDADPYLPWLHDFFPSVDGTKIHFVAQNKRRCKTGKNFRKDLRRLEPQVALMQPTSVERIAEARARSLAPVLWHPPLDAKLQGTDELPRYRLAPFEESSEDGQFTRFICRFHATDFSEGGRPRTVVLAETLSQFPFNYEFVAYRKGKATMLTPKGKDTKLFWMSNLRFECPVPEIENLASAIASGETILSDGTPALFVDVIPIRTPPRYGNDDVYFTEDMVGPTGKHGFDPKKRWGDHNVMPRVEASGRWENIPICFPPRLPAVDSKTDKRQNVETEVSFLKPHVLSACLWASASFRTRGANKEPIEDTQARLEEWIEFHLLVGFDHIYVYDNSGAHTNKTSLASVLDRFPREQVTRIDWPSTVCNNNVPAHDNTGERSSQYAAENSCRTRYGPFTEFFSSFDTDEYLIPMGKYDSLKDVLKDAAKQGTNILSFRSSRAKLRWDLSREKDSGRKKIGNSTFLEAYNCDSAASPKPSWADRARKQIYRSDYVLYHFVHYSTVTKGILTTYREDPKHWRRQWSERSPSERVTDELNEATMLHTKTASKEQTRNWKNRCHFEFDKKWRGCFVGFPFPLNDKSTGNNESLHREDGMEYNCYENRKITSHWAPLLRNAMAKRRNLKPRSNVA